MAARPRAVMALPAAQRARCFAPDTLARIESMVSLTIPERENWDEADMAGALEGAEIAITGWGSPPIPDAALDACPTLRLVAHSAGTVRHLLPRSAGERGLVVTTARAALARSVAEYTLGMMLVAMKGLWAHTGAVRSGGWLEPGPVAAMREPHGATVGVVGASHAGRFFIELCQPLRLKEILVYDPYLPDTAAAALGVRMVDLAELLQTSDVVSLHVPATPETRHMIDAKALAMMRDGAILINTARGWSVDEAALVDALRQRPLLAILDVTDPEPPAPDSPLRQMENLILTPHIAGSIKEDCLIQGEIMAEEIGRYVQGLPLQHALDWTLVSLLA